MRRLEGIGAVFAEAMGWPNPELPTTRKEPNWKEQMATVVGWTIEDVECVLGDTEEAWRADIDGDDGYNRYR